MAQKELKASEKVAGTAKSDSGSGKSANGVSPLDAFTKLQATYNEYIKSLAYARQAWAQAYLTEMKGLNELQKARILSDLAGRLEEEIERLGRQERQMAKLLREDSRQAKFAGALIRGTSVAAYAQVVDAFKHFEQRIPIKERKALYHPLTVSPGSIQGSDFFPNGKPDQEGQDPPARALKNALTLINWSFEKRYIARDGSTAQEQFLAVFDAIGSIALKGIDAMADHIKEVRAEVYKAWNPVKVIGVITNAAQDEVLKSKKPKE